MSSKIQAAELVRSRRDYFSLIHITYGCGVGGGEDLLNINRQGCLFCCLVVAIITMYHHVNRYNVVVHCSFIENVMHLAYNYDTIRYDYGFTITITITIRYGYVYGVTITFFFSFFIFYDYDTTTSRTHHSSRPPSSCVLSQSSVRLTLFVKV